MSSSFCRLRPLLFAAALVFQCQAHAQQAGEQAAPSVREIQVAAGAFTRGDPVPAWVRPVEIPATSRRNPVVIRLADTQFRLGEPNSVFINRAVQVNDNSALARIGQYTLEFVPQYQKLRLHKVLILRDGKTTDHTRSVDVRFLQRETGLERGIYSGSVTASLLLSDVRVGDTLHIAYSLEGTNPVFGDMRSDAASWDQNDPVELRNVVLSYPRSRNINWRMEGDFRKQRVSPETSEDAGYRVLRWQERGIDGLDFEPYTPDSYLAYRLLEFSEYPDWNSVARWANTLFPPAGPLSPELRGVVEKLRALPTADARASGALQWVQNEIRYFGVSLGESSHRPYPPNEVAKRRFGDCKDKAYLLVTLLRELGIEARPVLVALSSRKMPAKVLPSPNMFDHVIVEAKIDGKSWYLDGTRLGQRGKLSQMGLGLEDAVGLVVAPDTRDLQVLHSPNVRELSTVEASDHFTLARLDGDGELQATVIWHGVNAENVRMVASQLTPEQMRRFALANYEVRYPGITLTGQPELSDDPENNRISLTAHYKVPKLAQESGGAWVMKFFPYNLRAIFNVPPQLSRNFPLAITTYPYVARYKLVMDWPDNVAMVLDPSTQRLDNDYFKLDIARSFRGNHATLDLLLETRTDELAPARLPRFMEELQKFNVALGGYIAIDRGALKKDGFLGFGRNTLQDNIRKRLQSTIDRTTRTIAAGRLSGEDLAGAYCDRAEALADIGKADEGMKDAQEAVRLAPEFSRAWECRGNLYFDNGDFAKAIPDLNKALGLGADEFSSFYRRGHARFYLGKLPEAAEDFAKAARQSKDGEGALYAELWQLWTLQRLKRSIPPELQAHATENPHGAWPRPALAMLAGVLTPEQMLDEVSRQKGDERELNEAEAYFYLGQHRLNQGQPQQAKEAFEKTRAKGITMYLEHVAAGFELGRLQGK